MFIDYSAVPGSVRDDLVEAHQRCWQRLASPGTWWTSAERVAIAAQTRQTIGCDLCRARGAALSPASVPGRHAAYGPLAAEVVDIVHRVRADSARLARGWFDSVVPAVISEERYVELVAVVAQVTTIDTFCAALGIAPHPLPAPLYDNAAPLRVRPAGARPGLAWVSTVAPEDLTDREPAIYEDRSAANIHRALSLVPEEVVAFFGLDDVHYLPDAQLRQFDREPRAISHAQIELLAARMSALNQCVY